MHIDVQFMGWESRTGDTTDRALFRASTAEGPLFDAKVGVTGSLLATVGLTEETAKVALRGYGPEYVRELAHDPAIVERLRSPSSEQRADLTMSNAGALLEWLHRRQ